MCACCFQTRDAATNFNFVSSLKATQVVLIIPQTSSSSGMEINIYRMAGKKRERRAERQTRKTGTEKEEATDTCGYDDNSFPFGRGQKGLEMKRTKEKKQ